MNLLSGWFKYVCRYASLNHNIYITADLWTLTRLRMRAIVFGTINVYSTNHEDTPTYTQPNTTRRNNDILLLTQRLQSWPNIKTPLFQLVVFAGKIISDPGFSAPCVR